MRAGLFRACCLAVAITLAACAEEDRPAEMEGATWVGDVRRAHEDADRALATNDSEQARAALDVALGLQVPPEVSVAHQRAVHQDVHFRIATVELARDAAREALQAADRGLALGRGDDLFTVNLLVVRGRALEALDRTKDAALAYYEALQINRHLLGAVLGADAGQR